MQQLPQCHALAVLVLLALSACGGGDNNGTGNPPPDNDPPVTSKYECSPDVPIGAGLFTAAPADMDDVAGVIPLGSVKPNSGHTIPVDHMYMIYPDQSRDGSVSYPVNAMGDGDLIYLFRERKPGRPGFDYTLNIKHSCSVTVYYVHLHELSPAIVTHLESHGAEWFDFTGYGSEYGLIFLGQEDGPPVMPLSPGQHVGNTRNYSASWDVGLVDTRRLSGFFVNANANRYPSYADAKTLYPLVTVDGSIYNLGNKTLNAACFIDYMADAPGLKSDWYAMLTSHPQECGRVGWDIPKRLRGVWFNPVIDGLSTIPLDYDISAAALSIVPDKQAPSSQVTIAWGLKVNAGDAGEHPEYALLDPANWTPPVGGVTQIENGFSVTIDHDVSSVINPDPANVMTGITVCYDLGSYKASETPPNGFNSILFHMTDKNTLQAKYDPTHNLTAQCSNIMLANPVPDADWITYHR